MNRTCSFNECGRAVSYGSLCQSHNAQRKRGEELRPVKSYNTGSVKPECTFDGCDRAQYGLGLCRSHWSQSRRGVDLKPIRVQTNASTQCSANGCEESALHRSSGSPLCSRHQARWRRHGSADALGRNDVGRIGRAAIADAVVNRDRSGCWTDWSELPCWSDFPESYGGAITRGYPTLGNIRIMWLSMEADGRPRPAAPANHGLHGCDNKLCWNPSHLRWGTHEENMQDLIDSRNYCQHCAHCNPQSG